MDPVTAVGVAVAEVAKDIQPFINEHVAQVHEKDSQTWRDKFVEIQAIENDGDRADRLLSFLLALIPACGEITGGIGTNTERLIAVRSSHFTSLVSIAIRFRKLTLDTNSLQFRRT